FDLSQEGQTVRRALRALGGAGGIGEDQRRQPLVFLSQKLNHSMAGLRVRKALDIDPARPARIERQGGLHGRAIAAEEGLAGILGVLERRGEDEERVLAELPARLLSVRLTCASKAVSAPGVTPSMRPAWPSVTGLAAASF